MDYPKHKHPHGIENTQPNNQRIWLCEECSHVFTDVELRQDQLNGNQVGGWGHICKSHPCRKGQRCESHLEPYIPEMKEGK